MRLYKTQYSFRISGNRGYDSNRVRYCVTQSMCEWMNEGMNEQMNDALYSALLCIVVLQSCVCVCVCGGGGGALLGRIPAQIYKHT